MAGNAKRVVGTLLFVVAILAVAWFLFLLFADAENLDDFPAVDEVPMVALITAVLLGVIALLLILLLLLRRWDRQEDEAEEAMIFFIPEEHRPQEAHVRTVAHGVHGPAPGLTIVPHDLAGVPLGAQQWSGPTVKGGGNLYTFHFPRSGKRAVYANDYIDIGGDDHLRLRTLLAAPPGVFRGTLEERPLRPNIRAPEPAPAPRRELPGDDFVRRLEERYHRAPEEATVLVEKEAEPEAKTETYYDYIGDVHDVIDVEGIGPSYSDKLHKVGVKTTARLCFEDPGMLADSIGVSRKTVETWQSMAELMKVKGIGAQYAEALARAGVDGIAELKRRSAQAIADQVNAYLDNLRVNVLGQAISARRIEGWQKAAKPMRRVRAQIPAE